MGFFNIFKASDTVYFPGCITFYKYKENFELYKRVFSRLGINIRVLDKKICSGVDALEAGYENEARKLARKNLDLFNENNIKSIITNSPSAYKTFKQDYPELLPDWNINIINTWELILDKLEKKPRLIKHRAMEVVTFHDSCYLGRYSGVYEEPRKILNLMGYEVKEMPNNKERSICCGSCGGLPRLNPELANNIAKERILEAKRLGVSKIIVTDFQNLELLKKNVGQFDIQIIELSEVLAIGLGLIISKSKMSEEEEILLDVKSNMDIEDELKEEDLYEAISEK